MQVRTSSSDLFFEDVLLTKEIFKIEEDAFPTKRLKEIEQEILSAERLLEIQERILAPGKLDNSEVSVSKLGFIPNKTGVKRSNQTQVQMPHAIAKMSKKYPSSSSVYSRCPSTVSSVSSQTSNSTSRSASRSNCKSSSGSRNIVENIKQQPAGQSGNFNSQSTPRFHASKCSGSSTTSKCGCKCENATSIPAATTAQIQADIPAAHWGVDADAVPCCANRDHLDHSGPAPVPDLQNGIYVDAEGEQRATFESKSHYAPHNAPLPTSLTSPPISSTCNCCPCSKTVAKKTAPSQGEAYYYRPGFPQASYTPGNFFDIDVPKVQEPSFRDLAPDTSSNYTGAVKDVREYYIPPPIAQTQDVYQAQRHPKSQVPRSSTLTLNSFSSSDIHNLTLLLSHYRERHPTMTVLDLQYEKITRAQVRALPLHLRSPVPGCIQQRLVAWFGTAEWPHKTRSSREDFSPASSSSSLGGTHSAPGRKAYQMSTRPGPCANLCNIHRGLNSIVIRLVFAATVAEVGLRLERFVEFLDGRMVNNPDFLSTKGEEGSSMQCIKTDKGGKKTGKDGTTICKENERIAELVRIFPFDKKLPSKTRKAQSSSRYDSTDDEVVYFTVIDNNKERDHKNHAFKSQTMNDNKPVNHLEQAQSSRKQQSQQHYGELGRNTEIQIQAALAVVQELRSLCRMWITPDAYASILSRQQKSKSPSSLFVSENPQDYRAGASARVHNSRWHYQTNKCEACMLARLGSDVPALLALRASLLSRLNPWREEPRMLRWVEAWIGNAAKDAAEEQAMLSWSQEQGELLRVVRKESKSASRKWRREKEKIANKVAQQSAFISSTTRMTEAPRTDGFSHGQIDARDQEGSQQNRNRPVSEEKEIQGNVGYEHGAQSEVGSKFGDWQDYMQAAMAAAVEVEDGKVSGADGSNRVRLPRGMGFEGEIRIRRIGSEI